jgi:hypothetical protein
MTTLDAHSVAADATAAAWSLGLLVEAAIEDIEAAIDDSDWETAVECSVHTLLRIGYCAQLLKGYHGSFVEAETVAVLARQEPEVIEVIASFGAIVDAREPDARRCLAAVFDYTEQVKARLPFELPAVRTPEGFFPTVRVVRELEKLRKAIGLEPFDWKNWGV